MPCLQGAAPGLLIDGSEHPWRFERPRLALRAPTCAPPMRDSGRLAAKLGESRGTRAIRWLGTASAIAADAPTTGVNQ